MTSNRRKFLTNAGYATLGVLLATEIGLGATNTPLRQIAASKGKRYGAAVESEFLLKEKDYANLIARECSVVTPNGELKWDATEPSPGQFNFAGADAIALFCLQNNIDMHGHTLFWHMGRPGWLSYPPDIKTIERHLKGVMGHYKASPVLKSWDIANEIIADSASDTDNIYGLRRGVKPELIRDLFLIAASVDNGKKFYLNDYGVENGGWKAEKFLKMIEYLKNSGAKIDGAGFQSHLWFSTAYGFDEKGFRLILKRLNEIKVKPVISELDIIIDTPLPDSILLLDQMVADGYKRFLDICFDYDVDTVINWGLTDRHTWIKHPDYMPWKFRGNASMQKFLRPLPYNENLQAKSARNAIANAFWKVKA